MGVLQGLVSHNGDLYAAWKGIPDDDRIFYSRWNGSGKWGPASQMGSATVAGNTSAGPSLGVLGSSLYAAWKGEWSDPRLFFAKFNDSSSTWENQIQIPNAYSDVGAALCALSNTQLVAAWKSIDQSLWYATYNGSKWTAPSQIPAVASSVGPSLASFGGKVYAAWKGEDNDQRLWYASYDGTKWSAQAQIPNVGSSVGPSLASVAGGNLYAIWKGEAGDETLWYSYYDGTKWYPQTQISGASSSIGAAIAEFNGNLYAMRKGKDADTSLYTAEFSVNSKAWSGWSNAISGNTGPDPTTLLAVPSGGNVNYLLADGKGAGAALTGTTVTIIVVDDIVPDNNGDYSFQINCIATPQPSGAQTFGWQQFGYRIAANQLFYWVNTFQQDVGGATQYINWDSRPPRLPANNGVVPLPNNRLPSGWQLTTTLATDGNNKVTSVTFRVTQANGTVVDSGPVTLLGLANNLVSGNLAPIANFQVILVAENQVENGTADTINFSAGKGIFLCYANNSLEATASADESLENSNMQYSPLPASYPNGEFFQFFGVPSA